MECRKVLRMKLSEVELGQIFTIKLKGFGTSECIKIREHTLNGHTRNILNIDSWIVGYAKPEIEVEVLGKLSLAELE
jgi:hypothetical protein